MSKKIEVTIVRRTYTTYEVEVADDFDANADGAYRALESLWFDGGGMDWELVDEEVANWDIDYVGEVR